MRGRGLLKGLGVTFRTLFKRPITVKYPFEKLKLSPRFRGGFTFDRDRCIACKQCQNACPNNVITVTAERGEDKKLRLTGYDMDLRYCLFCGFCVEACPTQCLQMTDDYELAVFNKETMELDFADGKIRCHRADQEISHEQISGETEAKA